jgi:mono/diheme cytochrome c family protein
MKRRMALLLILMVVAMAGFAARASQPGTNKEQVVRGKKLFLSYCASCHGIDGAGAGAVAPALKQQPPDLRKLQSKKGMFLTEEVRVKIAGDMTLSVHGKRDMPVWGMVLSSSDINSLVKYLESIQRSLDPQTTE